MVCKKRNRVLFVKNKTMIFNLNNDKTINDAINEILKHEGKEVLIKLVTAKQKEKEQQQERTLLQNRARWQYLTMIAEELNERGETYQPKGMKIEVKFTKDLLYLIYWRSLHENQYPDKKENHLNSKEFSNIVELALMFFLKVFEIKIPFPNYRNN